MNYLQYLQKQMKKITTEQNRCLFFNLRQIWTLHGLDQMRIRSSYFNIVYEFDWMKRNLTVYISRSGNVNLIQFKSFFFLMLCCFNNFNIVNWIKIYNCLGISGNTWNFPVAEAIPDFSLMSRHFRKWLFPQPLTVS